MISTQPHEVKILGAGAWGPGFANWQELKERLSAPVDEAPQPSPPKPAVIPANERRRAPLLVRIAVEVSSQALQQSALAAQDVACVFGSGLGDTEITDYMCRQLATEEKLLSPTKFHNSVHNAAAGYWTISSHCMRAANSIAGFEHTAGLAVFEAMSHALSHNEPVLITLFDIAAQGLFADLFDCEQGFAAALIIAPPECPVAQSSAQIASASIELRGEQAPSQCHAQWLKNLQQGNPAAALLPVFEAIYERELGRSTAAVTLGLSANSSLQIVLE